MGNRAQTTSTSRHVVLITALTVIGVWLHHAYLFEKAALVDEAFYEAGIAAYASGRSPYDAEGYMYPPTFAVSGLALQRALGARPARLTIRWINFAALVGILWFTVQCFLRARTVEPSGWALVLAALLLMASPGVRLGINVGNVSFLIGALVLAGFWWADRIPLTAGLALAASLLLKPLAAGSLPLLLLPTRTIAAASSVTRIRPQRWLTAAIAGFASLSILWFFRQDLSSMFGSEMTYMAQSRSLSLYRISRLLGLGELRLPIFSVVVVALCATLWGRLETRTELFTASLAAIPATTLAVWSHTLVLFFPVTALALARMLNRRYPIGIPRAKPLLPTEPIKRAEVLGVVGAISLVYFVHSGGFPQLPPAAQIALLVPPTVAPLGLTVYWFATTRAAKTPTAL